MTDSDFWLRKIYALLHDPPNKSFIIKNHEEQAHELAGILGHHFEKRDYSASDSIASAADRLNFPKYRTKIKADFTHLSHPLAGELSNFSQLLPENFNSDQLKEAVKESLSSVSSEIKSEPKKLFLWLWRNWSAQIQQTEGNQLGALWDLLPADTRIPDHSIWAHQALTSAIAAARPEPAFLLFAISPVQAFISAARRTMDLWAGSYLLSYLIWFAIRVIADEIGPDAVVYPSLLGQPLCDGWLRYEGILPKLPEQDDLILSSLPNRFLAIVPYNQGVPLAEKATGLLKSQWQRISQEVRRDLEKALGYSPAWSKTWERQVNHLFETYWQVYPWSLKSQATSQNSLSFFEPHKRYLGTQRTQRIEDILNVYKVYAKPSFLGGGEHLPNIGSIYGSLYYITDRALGSRKNTKSFLQVDETGEKSTLGGERAALYDGIDNQGTPEANFDRFRHSKIREFWKKLAASLQSQNPRRYEIEETGKERLDAVELTKRCAWRSYFEKQPGFASSNPEKLFRFPSTNSIASASFKKAILERLAKPDCNSLWQSLEAWIEQVYPVSRGNRSDRNSIPYLAKLAADITDSEELIDKFLRLDGRLLFEETYQKQHLDELHGANEAQVRPALETLKNFLKVCREDYGIAKPRRYFAVLMMDGDEMGKWIAGDKMPEYEKVLHPKTREQLKEAEYQQDWHKILETSRLMSPAIHGYISRALGDFSLKLVRYIVEIINPGKLVYAGGDDVLALLPVDYVLKVARELRAAFSGEIDTGIGTEQQGKKFEVDFGGHQSSYARSGYVLLPGEDQPKLLATMGCKSTASTGIAIAYRLSPLDLTLQEVRKAEKDAKGKEGRNAFSITFLKRSGETMSAGAKWTYHQNCGESNLPPIDTVSVLLEFQRKFAENSISSKFPYILQEEAETLSILEVQEIQALYKVEIKRLLLRQQGSKQLSKEVADDLAEKLATLVTRANEEKRVHAKDENKAKPQGKLKTFADILTFTRFLATGEGED